MLFLFLNKTFDSALSGFFTAFVGVFGSVDYFLPFLGKVFVFLNAVGDKSVLNLALKINITMMISLVNRRCRFQF